MSMPGQIEIANINRGNLYSNRFFEVFVNTPLDVCQKRDVKGLYQKAALNLISGFTGVSQKYEPPETPDLIVTTENLSIRDSTNCLIKLLERENVIPNNLQEVSAN